MPLGFSKLKPVVNYSFIGDCLNLYTCKNYGKKAPNLIIDGHGSFEPYIPGKLVETDTFQVPPATWFYFYAPHGSIIYSCLDHIMGGAFEPLETYLAGHQVANYTLDPLEGRCGEPGFIKKIILKDRLSPNKNARQHPLRAFDVVQPKWRNTSLRHVINVLIKTNNMYPRIHCLFCRTTAFRESRNESSHRYNPAEQENTNIHESDVGRWHFL